LRTPWILIIKFRRNMRPTFIKTLVELAQKDERIFLLTGDLGYAALEPFREKFPKRFINMGVAEQNMAGFAAGLAMSGKLPVVYSIATFVTLKTLEQVRNDICYQNLNVKIVGVGSGLTYSQYGATHHSQEDIGLMRLLPNMKVICPGDPVEVEAATRAMMADPQPCYLRIGSRGEPVLHEPPIDFQIGKGITLRPGKDIALVATGNMLENTMKAAELLRGSGLSPQVVSMHTVKPLDANLLKELFINFQQVFTIEEHSQIGGFGSAVAELAAELHDGRASLHRIALPDQFQKLGAWLARLRQENGLSPEGIAETVRKIYNQTS